MEYVIRIGEWAKFVVKVLDFEVYCDGIGILDADIVDCPKEDVMAIIDDSTREQRHTLALNLIERTWYSNGISEDLEYWIPPEC